MVNASPSVLLEHSTLGHLLGVRLGEGAIQFRNLLYGHTTRRWSHAEASGRLSSDHLNPYDATKWGPGPPQKEDSIQFDFNLIQKSLPLDHELRYSENKCLNLVVTTPLLEMTKLPVIVFGGFFVGCNAWPQYNLDRLVNHSAKLGKPIVGVSINYRLGVLGFLPTAELDSSGGWGNYGLTDQALAFIWIQQHIAEFGGDPSNVTVLGESAGSISIFLHLLRGKPLFRRAICMSGDPRLRQPQPVETNYTALTRPLLEYLGLSDLPKDEQLSELQSMSWEVLVKSTLNDRVFPSLSDGFVPLASTLEQLRDQITPAFAWCQSLLVGDCGQDASAFFQRHDPATALARFDEAAKEFLSETHIQQLYEFYELNDDKLSDREVRDGLLQFTSDVRFYLPVHLLAMAAPAGEDVTTYHLLEVNPFDGKFKQKATHVLDIALTLQNYEEHLPRETADVGRHLAEKFINFAHGSEGLELRLDDAQTPRTIVFGPDGHVRHMTEKEYDSTERKGAAELLKRVGIDKCIATLELFHFGRRIGD